MKLTNRQRSYFAKALKMTRLEAGMPTAAALARESGVDVRTCYRYESGGAIPGIFHAMKLARACECTVEDIWGSKAPIAVSILKHLGLHPL